MSADADAFRILSRARLDLVLARPFFGALALRLVPVPDEDCADLWTDGVSLGFNPRALARRGPEETTTLLAHEILHLACEHHLRRGRRDPDLWNEACDLAVNGLLAEAGFALPRDWPVDPGHAGRPAEAIYAALLADRPERPGGAGRAEAGGEASPAEAEAGGGGEDGLRTDGRAKAAAPALAGTDLAGASRRQASAGGTGPSRGRVGRSRAQAGGEVRDHPALSGEGSPSRAEDLAARLRQDVSQALRAAADMGDRSAGLARFLNELARPRLDWTTLLRRFIRDRARQDYSWTPPNRRHVHQGLYLPSASAVALGDVVLAVDTSGSVDDALLRAFCAETSAVLDACDSRLLVYYCDAAVSGPLVLARTDPPPPLAPAGGGGTDYRPVFAQVEAEGSRPACLIYLTDLECDRFPPEPPYPVLWAAPASARRRPPFGELLPLP